MPDEIKTFDDFTKRYHLANPPQLLGEGGFGKVYLAFDAMRTRQVAVKVSEVKGAGEAYSLLSEFKLVKEQIPQHPNIAFYGVCYRIPLGLTSSDYAVMDYYPLGNLKKLRQNQPLTNDQKQDIALQILAGLQHLHSVANKGKGIIHRDLKSTNILIAQNPITGGYIPKIGDFGISKSLSSGSGHTSNSFAGGSLYYAAPEQLSGLESIGKNADLWSWGVLAYELYTGTLPFTLAETEKDESRQGRFYNLLKQELTPPMLHTLPPPIQEAIRRCLVFDKTKRLQTAEEVRAIITGGKGKEEEEIVTIKPTKSDYTELVTIVPDKQDEPKLKPEPQPKPKQETPPPPTPNGNSYWLQALGIIAAVVVVGVIANNLYNGNSGTTIDEPTTTDQLGNDSSKTIEAPAIADPFANDMVYVQGGTFTMGCTPEQGNECGDNEKPPHSKTVSSFYIGKYEVTQAQWRQVMGSNPRELYNKGCDQCPVDRVSHHDIQEFIEKLNQQTGKTYRLPTEAEWEYAARGGNKSKGYKYAGSNNIDAVAWYGDNYEQSKHGAGGTTHPVGTKAANELGLYDMSGNVSEWCQDWYKGYPGSSGVSDFTDSNRVLRGGSRHYNPQNCRAAYRSYNTPASRSYNLGFRVGLSP